MSEDVGRGIPGIDGPRPLDAGFRVRLERAMVASTAAGEDEPVLRWAIDDPRELPPRFRAKLEARIIRRTRPGRSLQMRLTAAIAAVLVASTAVVVADRLDRGGQRPLAGPVVVPPAPTPPAPPPAPLPPGSLRAFTSEAEFLSYVRGEALKLTGPYGIESVGLYGGFGPVVMRRFAATAPGTVPQPQPQSGAQYSGAEAPAGSSYSTTNVQEAGVDEPDIVKTDGRRLVHVSPTRLSILEVADGTPRLRGSIAIPNGSGAFLIGDRVIHFASLFSAPPEAVRLTHLIDRPWTKVTVVDIARPATPQIVNSFEVEGSQVDARLVGGVVRLVVNSGVLGPAVAASIGDGSAAALKKAEATNKRVVSGSAVGDWVPHFVIQRKGAAPVTGHVHDWSAVSRPPDRAGVGMLTILTIDPANPRPDNALSVVGAGQIVYASTDSLYVTSNALDEVLAIRSGRTPKAPVSRIHKFDIRDPSRARYVASGEVPGTLLNQFSLSEMDGYLRVATTIGANWFAEGASASSSRVSVLAEQAGKLIVVGSVGNLGKGERIYSVRFLGTKAYVVTFRQIDPLYVIDLATPTKPVVRGQLKIPGYSDYLHPISDTLLFGVGRHADANGIAGGLQVSLFDVSNPAKPRRIDVGTYGMSGSSTVGNDHHGFLYWEPKQLVVIPAEIVDDPNTHTLFLGALAMRVSSSAIDEPIRLTHSGRGAADPYSASIQRSLVIGSRLFTVSFAGVLSSDLASLTDRAWVGLQQ